MNKYIIEPTNTAGIERDIHAMRNTAIKQRKRALRQQKFERFLDWLDNNQVAFGFGISSVILLACAILGKIGIL